jgi:hypothetical protein
MDVLSCDSSLQLKGVAVVSRWGENADGGNAGGGWTGSDAWRKKISNMAKAFARGVSKAKYVRSMAEKLALPEPYLRASTMLAGFDQDK